MGVRLRSRHKTAKCGMAHEKFSSEESTHKQIQGENNDCFFVSRGIVHKEFVPPGQLITPSTKMSWNDFENGSSESEGHCCRRLGAAPQRAGLQCAYHSRISGDEKHSRTSTSTLQPRSSSVRFLPLP